MLHAVLPSAVTQLGQNPLSIFKLRVPLHGGVAVPRCPNTLLVGLSANLVYTARAAGFIHMTTFRNAAMIENNHKLGLDPDCAPADKPKLVWFVKV